MSSHEITRVGPYVLEAKLARGGFGDIWQAHREHTGEQVAVKILHPELVVSEAIVMRFEREAEAIRTLRHPHVVQLIEFGKLEDHRPYLVMELLQGPNLESYVHEHGALRPRRVLSILEPLCSALSTAHGHGIIHRDLKASNVVLDESTGHERLVLLDFGIVKLLEGSGPELTASRVTLGSPVCMAPEQIQGRPVDPRTDVYALGSLTFLMLTGEQPFPGRSREAMHQHLMAQRPRPSDRMDMSLAYDDIVVKAMAKKQADRFDSANEFLSSFRYAVELDEASSASISVPDMAPGGTGASTLCAGLYVEVCVAPADLEAADDALLDDMDAIYPRAAGFLERNGFLLAYESGDSALFILPLPKYGSDSSHLRKRTVERARELLDILDERDGRDPRIRVCIHLHVDEVVINQGLVTEGALLDIPRWVEPRDDAGISATSTMLEGIDPGELPSLSVS